MSSGWILLLDEVAALAKAAAASVDDIAAQATKAGGKAAGIIIDDAAVTPKYVVGISPKRELPIVFAIARGSIFNKLVILLPAAILLSYFAPWVITPILMLGGLYLSFEGAEKIIHKFFHKGVHTADPAVLHPEITDPVAAEKEKIDSAVRTDLILSAEIMAITLATIDTPSLLNQIVTLAIVGVGITFVVYGAVALIVKADDVGLHMAKSDFNSFGLGTAYRTTGLGLVKGMPYFLKMLTIVGTAAMLWVGGGIILHGLEGYDLAGPARFIHDIGHSFEGIPAIGGLLSWLVGATGAAVVGMALGTLAIPLVTKVIAPFGARFKKLQ